MVGRPSSDNQVPGLTDILNVTSPPNVPKAASGFRRVLGSIAGGLGNVMFPGMGTVIGGAIAGQAMGAAMPTLGSDTTQYLALQQQIQQESLAFETASTILKERHTAAMDAVRNMKS